MSESHYKFIRYIISGGTAAVINIFLLYLLTEFFKFWYLFSAIASFIVAFVFSFILQKFWTFGDNSKAEAHKQLAIYLFVAIVNLLVNTLLIYLLVEYLTIWYIWAQIISGATIALYSFFVYKLIFYETTHTNPKG